jgi:D-alanyl-D-alanine carboxypeptidase
MYLLRKLFLFIGLLTITTTSAIADTSSIVIDAQSGNVLYADNAEKLRYPASLTKLMTLYITFNALETGKLKLTDKLKVSRTAASRSPSKLGMPAGSYIDVKTLIQALIVKSANDCATVLAEALSPTERDFAVLMTKTAHKLGMYRTTFKNASGLPNSQQKTTATALNDVAFQQSVLGNGFNVEEMVKIGYYPHVIFTTTKMPTQPYIPLPEKINK